MFVLMASGRLVWRANHYGRIGVSLAPLGGSIGHKADAVRFVVHLKVPPLSAEPAALQYFQRTGQDQKEIERHVQEAPRG